MQILVLQHAAVEHPGIFRDFFNADGFTWHPVEIDEGEPIPDLAPYDLMLVMGGPQDVWQEDEHPWLRPEKEAIRNFVVDMRRPYLGICLGHQLLAAALGGTVGPAASPEVGIMTIAQTDAGQRDPLLSNAPDPDAGAAMARGRDHRPAATVDRRSRARMPAACRRSASRTTPTGCSSTWRSPRTRSANGPKSRPMLPRWRPRWVPARSGRLAGEVEAAAAGLQPGRAHALRQPQGAHRADWRLLALRKPAVHGPAPPLSGACNQRGSN